MSTQGRITRFPQGLHSHVLSSLLFSRVFHFMHVPRTHGPAIYAVGRTCCDTQHTSPPCIVKQSHPVLLAHVLDSGSQLRINIVISERYGNECSPVCVLFAHSRTPGVRRTRVPLRRRLRRLGERQVATLGTRRGALTRTRRVCACVWCRYSHLKVIKSYLHSKGCRGKRANRLRDA